MPKRRVPPARCVDCGRPRWDRFLRCKRCQKFRFSDAMEQSWRRRKRHSQIAREAQLEPARPTADLATLMAQADAAAARALEAALRLSERFGKRDR
jgi:hypothetical protein